MSEKSQRLDDAWHSDLADIDSRTMSVLERPLVASTRFPGIWNEPKINGNFFYSMEMDVWLSPTEKKELEEAKLLCIVIR